MRKTKPRTSTERNRRRNRRAARILGGITLNAEHDRKLDAILQRTGETTCDWVRRMILEQAK